MPRSAWEAVSLANEGLPAAPESITVKTIVGERFERITGWRLKERPVICASEETEDSSDENSTEENGKPENVPFQVTVCLAF